MLLNRLHFDQGEIELPLATERHKLVVVQREKRNGDALVFILRTNAQTIQL